MAEDVANTLRLVFQKAGGLDPEESEALLVLLRVNTTFLFINRQYLVNAINPVFILIMWQNERRYQEDIFGITYRAPDTVIANRRQQ